jgi:hypothetical protein
MLKRLVAAAAILCSVSATSALADPDKGDKPNRLERGAARAVQGTQNTARRAAKFTEKTAVCAGKFVERTATKVDKSVRKALE